MTTLPTPRTLTLTADEAELLARFMRREVEVLDEVLKYYAVEKTRDGFERKRELFLGLLGRIEGA